MIEKQRWLIRGMFVGMVYLAIGLVSSALAAAASSDRWRFFWRLSAFVISGVVFAAHVTHEHVRLRDRVPRTAWHVSLAVALGAFGLALAANIHDLGSASGYRPRMLVALVAWPLLTAVPAFIVAAVIAAGLDLKRLRA